MPPPSITRRRLAGGALASLALAGCSTRGLVVATARERLHPVRVSADRVTRVLVGLRPYRPSGFVVRREALGTKHLVHNYGHGGAGITLSWGTSQLALEIGFDTAVRRYAVIGCGAVGLATATLLQRRGAAVTIYAKALPPETTSNIAGGHFSPYSVYETATPEFLAQFQRALRISHREFQNLVGPRHGVSWHRNFTVNDRPMGRIQSSVSDLFPERAQLGPGEHPFGDAYVERYVSLMIEPPIYLRALMDTFLLHGGRIEVREFASRDEIAAIPESVVFNCTGLGARALFGDEEMIPARGQLVALLPQPEIDYNVFSRGFYMFPRTDGILLGGTFERGAWDLEPSAETTARILEGNAQIMARLTA